MTALTATVEVKYVNPPKDGKQYGSIKSADNDSWPVKRDRIHEFEAGNAYELAYTEGNNGFRNIIGVKRIVPAAPRPLQGEFTVIEPQPRNGATLLARGTPQHQPQETAQPSTKATQNEQIFATGGIYRDIEMGRVGTSEDELVERTILWRNVYRRAFPE